MLSYQYKLSMCHLSISICLVFYVPTHNCPLSVEEIPPFLVPIKITLSSMTNFTPSQTSLVISTMLHTTQVLPPKIPLSTTPYPPTHLLYKLAQHFVDSLLPQAFATVTSPSYIEHLQLLN